MENKKRGKHVLFAGGIRFETRLPRAEGLFDSSIISNILIKRQLTVNITILAFRSLDGEVPVLVHEALCPLVECLLCRICLPLCMGR